jgi:GABA permease
MSRVLVVANETVDAEELLRELRRIEDERTSTFRVVAPARPSSHGVMEVWRQDGAIDAARARLARTLEILKEEGLEASGDIGDMHPMSAIRDALEVFDADLIVISTHPAARSGWLRGDLVEKARKKFGKPVVHVVSTAREAPAAEAPDGQASAARS